MRRGRGRPAPQIPALPGRFASRLTSGIVAALRDWRHNAYVRLALRRIVVLTPLVVVLEAWPDPGALYALVVAFSITQPSASDTLNRALARTAGTIGSILVTIAVAVVAPDWVLVVFAVLGMVGGAGLPAAKPFPDRGRYHRAHGRSRIPGRDLGQRRQPAPVDDRRRCRGPVGDRDHPGAKVAHRAPQWCPLCGNVTAASSWVDRHDATIAEPRREAPRNLATAHRLDR
ncbi:MAG: FUSC family protein [Dermatophilaceae bacterium]